MRKNEHHYESDDDDDFDSDEQGSTKKKKIRKNVPLWDSFQDPPPNRKSGSVANQNKFSTLLKCFKCFVYLFSFIVVLFTAAISKNSFILMVGYIQPDASIRYCDNRNPQKEFYATIPENQRISWIWTLILAFSTPEIFTFLRSLRICAFKKVNKPSLTGRLLVGLMEILHTIGVTVLTFIVLPQLDSAQGLMLTCCICVIPGILGIISIWAKDRNSIIKIVLCGMALLIQLTGLIFWPIIEENLTLIVFTVIGLLLISCRWWENYSIQGFIPTEFSEQITELRNDINKSRYYIYLFLSPLKILTFILVAFLLDGQNFWEYFKQFSALWSGQNITVKETIDIYSDRYVNATQTTTTISYIVQSWKWAQLEILFIHIISSYLCYIFAKFACKIKIQKFSFSGPLSISIPFTLITLIVFCGLKEEDACFFHDYLPDYLPFRISSIYGIEAFFTKECVWIGVLWWLSQVWITRHIWFPGNNKNASTDKLFIAPFYSSFVIDQCIMLNRRRLDKDDFETSPSDKIPQLIVCATMWHEKDFEMIEFLKSILRLDEDQCARRMARKYFPKSEDDDDDYYELESHIFFDDAFIVKCNDPKKCINAGKCIDPEDPPINEYVETLIKTLDEAVYKVYDVRIPIAPPEIIKTPYGGRLIWTLPGQTKLIAHLKNIEKIRNKKRWSQVMYMYYLLGYRLMQMDIPIQRKEAIAKNYFLLALDGDIDFQPKAVQLLISRMKVNPELGAACGRIHPVGKGPMVWFQIFEYAIGHWLQKATEHVIGCVLCSPGCFSLFRGEALIEPSVMKKYTSIAKKPHHLIQYDQGEDRWLCTLLLKQKFRVEYSAASDAYTHSPEGFSEFYKQRRRWIPSTLANIFDLLSDAKLVVKNNNSISFPYICYQGMLMIGNILGPGTIFLMVVGSFVTVFDIDIWTSFLWNVFPVLIFIIICQFCPQDFQLITAFILTTIYSLVMMAVLIGIVLQIREDSVFAPSSLFLMIVAGQIVIAASLHPQEFTALFCGIVYYVTIPSMYMLLMIYSIFNLDDGSWGTRESPDANADSKEKQNTASKKRKSKVNKIFDNFKSDVEEKGLIDFSLGSLMRCAFCTHPQPDTVEIQLKTINENLTELNDKLKTVEKEMTGVTSEENKENSAPEQVFVNKPIDFDKEKIKEHNLPGWSTNKIFNKCLLGSLSAGEQIFWEDFIKKYLKPLNKSEKEEKDEKQKLREFKNIITFAFVMMNAIFILTVFLLQMKKDLIHVRWPFNAENTIEYDDTTQEVKISRKYLQLDPIGSAFVLLFGIILLIQFIAMLFHRFGTIAELLATTNLNLMNLCNRNSNDEDPSKRTYVERAKLQQKPKRFDESSEEEENDSDSEKVPRKSTIHKLILNNKRRYSKDWSNLEENFKRRLAADKSFMNNANTERNKKPTLLNNTRVNHSRSNNYTYDNRAYASDEP